MISSYIRLVKESKSIPQDLHPAYQRGEAQIPQRCDPESLSHHFYSGYVQDGLQLFVDQPTN